MFGCIFSALTTATAPGFWRISLQARMCYR